MSHTGFRNWGFGLLVLAVILGIYLPGLNNELIFDDMRLKDGAVFGQHGSLLEYKQRMLSYGSFVWTEALAGDGWWKQRLVNLFLHLATVAALFALTRELLDLVDFPADFQQALHFEDSKRAAVWLGVGVFAANPVAVYAVAYLIQRSIVMATLFTVLACWALVRGLRTRHLGWFAGALVAYLLAVLCKEHAFLGLFLVVPLFVYVRRPAVGALLRLGAAGLALGAVVFGVLWSIYGDYVGTLFDARSKEYAALLATLSPGIEERMYPLSLLNEAGLFFAYGFLWLFPNVQWMAIDLRPAFPLSMTSLPQLGGALGYIALLLGACWMLITQRNGLRLVGLCLLLPLLLFLTEFGTVWVQDPFVLYRSYLWAIALPGLVAVACVGFKPKSLYVLGSVLLLSLGGLALERTLSLRDGLTVWADAAAKIDQQAPANAVGRWQAFLNLGAYHIESGSLQEAEKALHTAIKMGESKGYALFNLALVAQKQRQHAKALGLLARSQAQGFAPAMAHYYQGVSLFALQRFPEAFIQLSAALDAETAAGGDIGLKPAESSDLRALHGETAIALKQYPIALTDFQNLLKREPQSARARKGQGMALVGLGQTSAALAVFDQLLASQPSAQAWYGKAMAHFHAGHKAESLAALDQAIALEPRNAGFVQIRTQIANDQLSR